MRNISYYYYALQRTIIVSKYNKGQQFSIKLL